MSTKGAAILDHLRAAPARLNPAVLMQQKLQRAEAEGRLSVADLLLMSGEIEKAIAAGGKEISRVGNAFNVLKNTDAQTAKTTPVGF